MRVRPRGRGFPHRGVARAGDGELTDVFPSFQYRRHDDENKDDRTVFSVDLPFEVADG